MYTTYIRKQWSGIAKNKQSSTTAGVQTGNFRAPPQFVLVRKKDMLNCAIEQHTSFITITILNIWSFIQIMGSVPLWIKVVVKYFRFRDGFFNTELFRYTELATFLEHHSTCFTIIIICDNAPTLKRNYLFRAEKPIINIIYLLGYRRSIINARNARVRHSHTCRCRRQPHNVCSDYVRHTWRCADKQNGGVEPTTVPNMENDYWKITLN